MADPLPTLNKYLEDQEYEYLRLAMEVSHGVVKKAARIAGREPGRFYKKLLDYGIKARDYRGIYHCQEWHAAHKKGTKCNGQT
jgi:DNA-binding NtrC family response regulator